MFLTFLFSILFASAFPQIKSTNDSKPPKKFNFLTSQNKKFILENPSKYLQKRGILSKVFNKLGISTLGNWYYVHFLTNNLEEISKQLNITVEDTVVKNTFILYLTEDELSKISDVTLVKKLSPEDKIQESTEQISKSNYFHIITKTNSKIPTNPKLYTIERQESSNSYLIRIEKDKKEKALTKLSQINTVRLISSFTPPTFSNSIMNGYTQQNRPPNSIKTDKNSGVRYLDRYVNNKGLTGSGETIAILDTPIDFYHSNFRDDKVKVQLNTKLDNHRKFVYYGSNSKSLDEWVQALAENEHGTIMAGITAGKSICSDDSKGTSMFNGNAYDSKILYAGNPNFVSAETLGNLMKTYNSYISSNSWGIDDYNDAFNYNYGNLAYNNPERLFLFAAGNSYQKKGNFTIGDPGSSKNVLTVGAIGNFYEARPKYRIQSLRSKLSIDLQAIADADPWVSGTFGNTAQHGITAIYGLTGRCPLINNGHVSVIYSPQPTDVNWVYQCGAFQTTGILFTQDVQGIQNLLAEQGEVTIYDVTDIDPSATITHAPFSSGGPGSKGVLKPDISAPGQRIISTKSVIQGSVNHGCLKEGRGNFTISHGTSASTANVAGAAALVRQYFKSGRWKEAVEVDGTTLRALLINSCKHPYGWKQPDVLFGHGVVDLSSILPLENSFGVQITPSKIGGKNKPSVGKQKHVSAKLSVNPNGKPLQITLSYLDPVLDSTSPIPIARDLDLVVVSPSKEMFKGDHLDGDTQHFSTNEKIIIDNPEKGEYTIHVIGGDFVDSSVKETNQEFAVVATGPVTNDYIQFAEPTTCPCQTCDKDNKLVCACSDDLHIGPVCQSLVFKSIKSNKYVTVDPLRMSRVYFKWNKVIKSVFVESPSPGRGSTVWIAPKCTASLSEYPINGQTGQTINVDYDSQEICVAVFNNNDKQAEYKVTVRSASGDGGGDDGDDGDEGDEGDGGDDDGSSGSHKKKNKTGMIVGIVFAVIAVIAIAGVVTFIVLKKRNGSFQGSSLLSSFI